MYFLQRKKSLHLFSEQEIYLLWTIALKKNEKIELCYGGVTLSDFSTAFLAQWSIAIIGLEVYKHHL